MNMVLKKVQNLLDELYSNYNQIGYNILIRVIVKCNKCILTIEVVIDEKGIQMV